VLELRRGSERRGGGWYSRLSIVNLAGSTVSYTIYVFCVWGRTHQTRSAEDEEVHGILVELAL
jgi:hypothetical protein